MNDQYLPKEDVDDASIRESLLPAWNTSDDKDSSSSGGGGGIGVPRPKLSCRAVKAALGVSLVLNLALVATVGLIVSLHGQNGDPQLGVWSPVNDAVKYEKVVWYDNIDHFSPWQLAPDDALDELWSGLYSGTAYTLVDAEKTPLLPNQTVIAPGTGGDGLVQIEMFHALHCINALRKSLWPERYPEYSIFQNGQRDDTVTTHHAHCIERLRMNIMCAGNTGMSTFRWVPEASRWMINMEMTYMCRDFESIRQWVVSRDYPDWDDHAPSSLTP